MMPEWIAIAISSATAMSTLFGYFGFIREKMAVMSEKIRSLEIGQQKMDEALKILVEMHKQIARIEGKLGIEP